MSQSNEVAHLHERVKQLEADLKQQARDFAIDFPGHSKPVRLDASSIGALPRPGADPRLKRILAGDNDPTPKSEAEVQEKVRQLAAEPATAAVLSGPYFQVCWMTVGLSERTLMAFRTEID